MKRDKYLNELVALRHNGMIKVITGIRRCGKSYLLFNIFATWLEENGVGEDHIIKVDLENYKNRKLRDPDELYSYVESSIIDGGMYYILLDEVQMLGDFEAVLNGFLHIVNADIYVTGSNARFLSKDVITEFRGRGFEVRVNPFSFSEFMSQFEGSLQAGLNEYLLYGGLPQAILAPNEEVKVKYLKTLFAETYIRDIKERYGILHDSDLEDLTDIIASDIGALTNPSRIANTFRSEKRSRISYDTVKLYLDYLCDAFIVEKCSRFDVKGRRYINSLSKYYFTDLGLRNARIGFRQDERTHLMENLVYNELRIRGFNVDVGVVPVVTRADGRQKRSQLEIDFVCNLGSRRYYVQSAYRMSSEEKEEQEKASLGRVDDSFKKIVIVGEETPVTRDNRGIVTMSIYDFLTKADALDL